MSDNQIAPQSGGTDMTLIAYICYAAAFITGITAIVGVVIAYMDRDATRGTWKESHTTWLIRTFWLAFAGSIIGMLLIPLLGLGFLVLLGVAIWYIVRLVKGWMAYDKKQPIAKPDDLLFG
jgi:uncharacterized membrane protein